MGEAQTLKGLNRKLYASSLPGYPCGGQPKAERMFFVFSVILFFCSFFIKSLLGEVQMRSATFMGISSTVVL